MLGNTSNGLLAKDSAGNSVADATSMGVKMSDLLNGLDVGKVNLSKDKPGLHNTAPTLSQSLGRTFNAVNNELNNHFPNPGNPKK